MTRILGIDPGSRVTGFGVIDSDGQKSTHVAHGCLDVESGTLADRLRLIFEGVGRVVRLYQPDEMAVELVFMYRNPDSALKLPLPPLSPPRLPSSAAALRSASDGASASGGGSTAGSASRSRVR